MNQHATPFKFMSLDHHATKLKQIKITRCNLNLCDATRVSRLPLTFHFLLCQNLEFFTPESKSMRKNYLNTMFRLTETKGKSRAGYRRKLGRWAFPYLVSIVALCMCWLRSTKNFSVFWSSTEPVTVDIGGWVKLDGICVGGKRLYKGSKVEVDYSSFYASSTTTRHFSFSPITYTGSYRCRLSTAYL